VYTEEDKQNSVLNVNVHLQSIMIKGMVDQLSKSIDCMIIDDIDELLSTEQYRVHRSFTTRKGDRRHILSCNNEITDWLMNEQNQFGRKNPDWTISDGKINISDRLYTLLILKFGEPD
jgi:hypothetical protein